MPTNHGPSVRMLMDQLKVNFFTATKLHARTRALVRGTPPGDLAAAMRELAEVMAMDPTYGAKAVTSTVVWPLYHRGPPMGYQICFQNYPNRADRLVFDQDQWRFRIGEINRVFDQMCANARARPQT
jgi:hypothetical protein